MLFQLVQKMVSDRAPNVQAVKDSGTQLLKGKDPKERKKIEDELKQLDQRWDMLTKKVSDRAAMLEEVQGLANQFTEILDPLSAWLDASDKQFAALEPQTADAEGIEKLIGELQVTAVLLFFLFSAPLPPKKKTNNKNNNKPQQHCTCFMRKQYERCKTIYR